MAGCLACDVSEGRAPAPGPLLQRVAAAVREVAKPLLART